MGRGGADDSITARNPRAAAARDELVDRLRSRMKLHAACAEGPDAERGRTGRPLPGHDMRPEVERGPLTAPGWRLGTYGFKRVGQQHAFGLDVIAQPHVSRPAHAVGTGWSSRRGPKTPIRSINASLAAGVHVQEAIWRCERRL